MLITNIGRLVTIGPLGVIKNAFIEIEDGKIKNFGNSPLIPPNPPLEKGGEGGFLDAQQGVVIPGLIDCHTHLVHAGNRADEFAARARGASYEEIAKAGGGIMSTVRATREANEDELFEISKKRANEALSHGITTIEVKSGYGLDFETEIKMLRVIKKLNEARSIEFVPTFLGAHTIPMEYLPQHVASKLALTNSRATLPTGRQGSAATKLRLQYIQLITEKMIPAVAKEKLAKFCDIFVERIAFTKEEGIVILKAAKKHGLKLKVHADQLSSCGGALLAAEFKAVSADHLEYLSQRGILAMKKAKVVPVLIPTSTFFVGGKYAPARAILKEGLPVAISTDYNPGTSPVLNLWFAAATAITQMKMTAEEAYKGITINAAKALGMEKTHGSVAKGKTADLVILNAVSEFEPLYRFDKSFVFKVIKSGEIVYG